MEGYVLFRADPSDQQETGPQCMGQDPIRRQTLHGLNVYDPPRKFVC